MAALGKSGNLAFLRFLGLLRFHRLAKAVALAIHLKNMAVVGQTVQQRRSHPLTLEDLIPLAERHVGRHQNTGALIAVAEDPKQKLDTASAQRDVTELVADQQVGPLQLTQESVQRVLLLRLLQLADQLGRREEPHTQTGSTGSLSQGHSNMCFSSAVTSNKAAIVGDGSSANRSWHRPLADSFQMGSAGKSGLTDRVRS